MYIIAVIGSQFSCGFAEKMVNFPELGVLYWKLNPVDYENDEELKKIRETRGYNYMVVLWIIPNIIILSSGFPLCFVLIIELNWKI